MASGCARYPLQPYQAWSKHRRNGGSRRADVPTMIIAIALEDDLLSVLTGTARSMEIPVNQLASIALREWAIARDLLPPDIEFDVETPTRGSA